MLPRFSFARVYTTDPTLDDDDDTYRGRVLVVGWLGLMLALQFARRAH